MITRMNLDASDFYQKLWEILSSDVVLATDDDKVMALFFVLTNSSLPYRRLPLVRMDSAEFSRRLESLSNDLDEIQKGGSGHAVTLYMLENCQGHKEGAESWKTVYKDLGFEALRNCTYIDLSIKVNRSNGEYQNLGYAIYLGKTDMRSDFDIVRNLFKTVKIVIPGADDPNPASHFFKFSGTDSPTVTPGESIDLYFVTNLPKEDIAVFEFNHAEIRGHFMPAPVVDVH